jgi:hypothetical protein
LAQVAPGNFLEFSPVNPYVSHAMLSLTSKDRLQHKASWHNPETPEGARLNQRHAALLGQDVAATKDRLMCCAIRAKLGSLPPLDQLAFRLVDVVDAKNPNHRWLHLDGELIAFHTVPETHLQGFRYVVSWYWKSLVNVAQN